MTVKIKPLLALALLPSLGVAEESASLGDAITQGDAQVMLRYRYEYVDQDHINQSAQASTLLARLNYLSKEHKGWQFFAEADHVTEVGLDDFNAGMGNTPGRTQYPVVADPSGTEINQAWVSFKHNEHLYKLGRQRLVLDNQRFIGGVAWRQNEQTFDAISYSTQFKNSTLKLAYINKAHRIFGDDVAAGNHDNQTLIANFSYKNDQLGRFGLYHYAIDNETLAGFSTATTGLQYQWKSKETLHPLDFRAEWAYQVDHADNPVDYSAHYVRLDGGVQFDPVKWVVGFEQLSGDADRSGASFRTPLATLHAFNGWADQFLATPAAGLEDWFFGAQFKTGSFNWKIKYHQFGAQDTGVDFGQELDLAIAKKLTSRTKALLKMAVFDGKGSFKDTEKMWFMIQSNF